MRYILACSALLLCFALPGCGDGAAAGGDDAGAPPPDGGGDPPFDSGPPLPTTGCGASAPSEGEKTLMVGAESRTYLLDLPAGYDPNAPHPLVFGFHGATSSAVIFQSDFYGGLGPVAGDEAILVYPQALTRSGTIGTVVQWQISDPEDLAFFDAMVDELSSTLCVDDARVFATGHSSGAYFTNRLGCERGDVLRAIAPLAGGGPFTFFTGPCVGQVAAWIEHGASDVTVTIDQGEGSRLHWRAENGCSATSAATAPAGCVTYSGCDAGYPVHWCESAGGHEPRPAFTGAGSWSFFASF